MNSKGDSDWLSFSPAIQQSSRAFLRQSPPSHFQLQLQLSIFSLIDSDCSCLCGCPSDLVIIAMKNRNFTPTDCMGAPPSESVTYQPMQWTDRCRYKRTEMLEQCQLWKWSSGNGLMQSTTSQDSLCAVTNRTVQSSLTGRLSSKHASFNRMFHISLAMANNSFRTFAHQHYNSLLSLCCTAEQVHIR